MRVQSEQTSGDHFSLAWHHSHHQGCCRGTRSEKSSSFGVVLIAGALHKTCNSFGHRDEMGPDRIELMALCRLQLGPLQCSSLGPSRGSQISCWFAAAAAAAAVVAVQHRLWVAVLFQVVDYLIATVCHISHAT